MVKNVIPMNILKFFRILKKFNRYIFIYELKKRINFLMYSILKLPKYSFIAIFIIQIGLKS